MDKRWREKGRDVCDASHLPERRESVWEEETQTRGGRKETKLVLFLLCGARGGGERREASCRYT